MGIQINGNNDIISALDGSWTAEGASINTSGILTATTFKGNVTGTACTFVDGNFTGNVTIGGTLTYEDVTNIDAVGLVTARSGVDINADNKYLKVGAGGDLQFVHTGGETFIANSTGHLTHRSDVHKWENYAGNKEYIRILSDGKVGINSLSPTYGMHLHGTGASNNAYYYAEQSSAGASAGFRLKTTGSHFAMYGAVSGSALGIYDYNAGAERFTIDSNGNITIGQDGDSGGAPSAGYDELVIEGGNENIGMCFLSPAANNVTQQISFGDSNNNQSGRIIYNHASDYMSLGVGGGADNERLRITSGGDIQVDNGNLHIDDNGEFAIFEQDTARAMTNSSKISMDFSSNVARIRSSHNGSGGNAVSRPLAFYIGSSEKLRIGSTGKLTFDYDSVENNLVDIDLRTNNGVQIRGHNGNSNNAKLYLGGSTENQRKTAIIHDPVGGYCRGDLHFCLENAADLTDVDVTDSKMVIKADGKVGINTTIPTGTLEIADTGEYQLILKDNNNPGPGAEMAMGFKDNANTIQGWVGFNQWENDDFHIGNANSGGHITFKTNNGSAIGERLRITSGGDINIHNRTAASSTDPVTVDFGGQYTPDASITHQNLKVKLFSNSSNNDAGGLTMGQSGVSYVSSVGAGHLFYTSPTTVNTLEERLRITHDGVINFGHGTETNLHGKTTTGVNINGNGNSGQIIANASGNRALIIGRQSSYGQVIEFFQGTNTNEAAITIPAANSFGIETSGTERLRIDSAGRLIVEGNNATSRPVWGIHSAIQVNGTGWDDTGISLNNFGADSTRATLTFMKSKNGTIGNYSTVPGNGESMGAISWSPADGADANMSACRIEGMVAGTVNTTNAPGELRFYTNSGSSGSDAMVFNRLGRLGIGHDSPEAVLHPRANPSHGTDNAFMVGTGNRFFKLTELSGQDNFGNCEMSFYDNSLREILTFKNEYAGQLSMGNQIVFRGYGGKTGDIRVYNTAVNSTQSKMDMSASGGVGLAIDHNGYVTKPNHPAFMIIGGNNLYNHTESTVWDGNNYAPQSGVNNGNCVNVDTKSGYTVSNGRYTVPVGGIWHFHACGSTGTNHSHFCYITVNGGTVAGELHLEYSNGNVHMNFGISETYNLNAGDYVNFVRRANGYRFYSLSWGGYLVG